MVFKVMNVVKIGASPAPAKLAVIIGALRCGITSMHKWLKGCLGFVLSHKDEDFMVVNAVRSEFAETAKYSDEIGLLVTEKWNISKTISRR